MVFANKVDAIQWQLNLDFFQVGPWNIHIGKSTRNQRGLKDCSNDNRFRFKQTPNKYIFRQLDINIDDYFLSCMTERGKNIRYSWRFYRIWKYEKMIRSIKKQDDITIKSKEGCSFNQRTAIHPDGQWYTPWCIRKGCDTLQFRVRYKNGLRQRQISKLTSKIRRGMTIFYLDNNDGTST